MKSKKTKGDLGQSILDEDLYKIRLGDCLDVLSGLPENTVDAIVTDPP